MPRRVKHKAASHPWRGSLRLRHDGRAALTTAAQSRDHKSAECRDDRSGDQIKGEIASNHKRRPYANGTGPQQGRRHPAPHRNASAISAEISANTASKERIAITRSRLAGIPRPKLLVIRQALTGAI